MSPHERAREQLSGGERQEDTRRMLAPYELHCFIAPALISAVFSGVLNSWQLISRQVA